MAFISNGNSQTNSSTSSEPNLLTYKNLNLSLPSPFITAVRIAFDTASRYYTSTFSLFPFIVGLEFDPPRYLYLTAKNPLAYHPCRRSLQLFYYCLRAGEEVLRSNDLDPRISCYNFRELAPGKDELHGCLVVRTREGERITKPQEVAGGVSIPTIYCGTNFIKVQFRIFGSLFEPPRDHRQNLTKII